MGPVPLIGRYPYSHWVLGARPGGIESYRPLPQLVVFPCDRGNIGGSPWLLRFVTGLGWRCWYHFGHDTCLVESNLEFITECGAVARGMGCWPSGGVKGGIESA